MSNVEISHVCFSIIWGETSLAFLESPQPAAPMTFLGRITKYKKVFQDAQHHLQQKKGLLPLGTPWTKRRGQHFWTRYLEGVGNVDVQAEDAWRAHVPLRAELPVTAAPETAVYKPQFELFFYPHAVALAVTLSWQVEKPLPLTEMVDQARQLRHAQRYPLAWSDDPPPAVYGAVEFPDMPANGPTLNQLGNVGLGVARAAAFGSTTPAGKQFGVHPFTVFTVIRGDIEGEIKLEDNSDIHKSLHVLTNWQGRRDVPHALSSFDVGLGKDANAATDLLYGQKRARAVWYPTLFASYNPDSYFALTCYHRNLMFASLQGESLCNFAGVTVADLQQGRDFLSSRHRRLSKTAAGILGRLYGGHVATYRSRSIQRYIEDNNWKEAANRLRSYCGMGPLHA
jgi:hypothetical protein